MIAFVIAVSGGFGAAARYLIDTLLQQRAKLHSAVSILLINIIGSFVFGVAAVHSRPTEISAALLTTAACAGFTTFSTASLDTLKLCHSEGWVKAVALAFGTLALCICAAAVGYAGGSILGR